jgi:hypothetical protein
MSGNAKSNLHAKSTGNQSSVFFLEETVIDPAGETATHYETAELSAEVDRSINLPEPRPVESSVPVSRPASTGVRISESGPAKERSETTPGRAVYGGVPSWLTSLVFHLSVVLILALVSVSDGGRKIMELVATAGEADEIEPFLAVDMALEPAEVEPLSERLAVPAAQKLLETSELDPILDNALLSAGFETEDQDSLFERISSAGLTEGEIPRRSADGGAKFFGVDGQGSNFIFIVDCSGSMADYGRWRQAVRELKKSIEHLKDDQRFLILLYNDGFVAMNDEVKLVKSTRRTQQKAFKWLSGNMPNSWTFCAQALAKALSLQPDAIFLLSDGEFNDRQDVFLVLDQMNSKTHSQEYRRQQIPIHTIALGSHQGRWTMKRIADENGGLFRLVE